MASAAKSTDVSIPRDVVDITGGATDEDVLVLANYREELRMRDLSHLLEKNVTQWHNSKIASRKDGTKCYFCGWQLHNTLLNQAQRMIQVAKMNKSKVPRYWSRWSTKGRRQRRTFDASPEALDACKEYLACESKMLRFVILRSEATVTALEKSGDSQGDKISEAEKMELEAQFLGMETCLEQQHRSKFYDGENDDWCRLKKEIYDDLYFLRPIGAGWEGMEEETVERVPNNYLGHVRANRVEDDDVGEVDDDVGGDDDF